MIQIKSRNDLVGPVAVCDYCGEEITNASDAACVWQRGRERLVGTFYFVHYDCDDEFMRARGDKDKTWSTVELDVWLAYLTSNVGWNEGDAREKAASMTDI
jgi:hypothetical protein